MTFVTFFGQNAPSRSIWGMKKPKKHRKLRIATTLEEDIGKFLLDFGKLVFAGIVFGSIVRYQIPQDLLLTSATAVATVSCIVGLILGIREKKTDTTAIKRRRRRKR